MMLQEIEEPVRGRLLNIDYDSQDSRQATLTLLSNRQPVQVTVKEFSKEIAIGDLIEVTRHKTEVLTQNIAKTTNWLTNLNDPRRTKGVKVRRTVEQAVRNFFDSRNFEEVRTPLLVSSPGMEPHIRPFKIEKNDYYLPTSPEFAMKKLLVGGFERIYQICPAFRCEPHSNTHQSEFTLLEWYRAYAPLEAVMCDTEQLVEFLAITLNGKPEIKFQDTVVSVKSPWPRLTARGLFQDYLGIDLVAAKPLDVMRAHCRRLGLSFSDTLQWDDLYFLIWLNFIEPKLPNNQALFVTDYPASQAALSKIKTHTDGTQWARRFEFYIHGLELGNAFEELTDPIEQRARFVKDMMIRQSTYGETFPASPIDEEFMNALNEGMPPASGIAVGIDRLVMLLADEPQIEFTFLLSNSSPPAV